MRAATLIGPTTRVRLVCILFLCAFGGLAVRAAHLTVVDSRGRGMGERQTHSSIRIPAPRGTIYDRSGVELAVTLAAPSIYVMPRALENRAEAAAQLAAILGHDPQELAGLLERRETFTFLRRWASEEQADRVRALELSGVGILQEPRRAYPAGALAGQLIGFANIDGEGVRALEQLEDDTLRGDERVVSVERDARGRLLAVDAVEPSQIAGSDVRLTIDAAFQAAAEAALDRAIAETGADGGAAVTIDPRTGDVLSLAEAPRFDPNAFRTLAFRDTRSRAFLDAVEPGSTLKAFLIAAALDEGVVAADERIDTGDGKLRIPGKTIRDHHGYGVLTLAEILGVSSNIGAVLIGQRLPKAVHYEALRAFGFGRRTGSGFPQESAGIMRSPAGWKTIDQATIAFGQGISVTPVQLAAATAALASEGVWREPRLVAARREPGGPWVDAPMGETRRAVRAETALATVAMMESVVSATGTGRRAALSGLRVAGKTGTAQKFDAELGRYSKTDYLAWFVGVVPAEAPQLAIVVVLDTPKGEAHGGGDTAAPLFAEIAAAQLAHFGIATAPAPIRARPFRTVLAAREEAAHAEQRETRARIAARQMLAETRPALHASPPATALAAHRTAPRTAPHAAPPVGPPAGERAERDAERSAAARASDTAHFVPDFRGETVASALRMAAQDSFVLELQGDQRGLAVEQHPDPGTVVTGDRPRVKLRFMLPTEES